MNTTTIAPLGAGLVRRNSEMQPEDVMLDRKKRLTHYVIAPAFDIDLTEQTWKRLSRTVFHRMRICALETFWYPTKNRSQAKMDNPTSEPELIAWEKKAFDQATEMVIAYGIYGLMKLDSLTGVDQTLVSRLEQLLFPLPADDSEESLEAMRIAYQAPRLLQYLKGQAYDNIKPFVDDDFFATAEKLRQELITCVQKSIPATQWWIDHSDADIAFARQKGVGKTALDPLDYKQYEYLGLDPRADLLARSKGSRVANVEYRPQTDISDAAINARIDARIAELKANMPAVAAIPTKEREMKLCKFCATEVFVKATFCITCKKNLPTLETPNAA